LAHLKEQVSLLKAHVCHKADSLVVLSSHCELLPRCQNNQPHCISHASFQHRVCLLQMLVSLAIQKLDLAPMALECNHAPPSLKTRPHGHILLAQLE